MGSLDKFVGETATLEVSVAHIFLVKFGTFMYWYDLTHQCHHEQFGWILSPSFLQKKKKKYLHFQTTKFIFSQPRIHFFKTIIDQLIFHITLIVCHQSHVES